MEKLLLLVSKSFDFIIMDGEVRKSYRIGVEWKSTVHLKSLSYFISTSS